MMCNSIKFIESASLCLTKMDSPTEVRTSRKHKWYFKAKQQLVIIVLFPIFLGLFLNQAYIVTLDFVNANTVTKTKLILRKTIKLPNLRICSNNWMNKSKLEALNISKEFLDYSLALFVQPQLQKKKLVSWDIETRNRLEKEFEIHQKRFRPWPKRYLRAIALSPELVFTDCYFGEREKNCSELLSESVSDMGPCFFFNRSKMGRQDRSGSPGGLSVVINLYRDLALNLELAIAPEDGIMVDSIRQLEPQPQNPRHVASGQNAYISVRKEKEEKITDCVDNKEIELGISKTKYTQQGCNFELFMKGVSERCNCSLNGYFFLDEDPNLTACSLSQIIDCVWSEQLNKDDYEDESVCKASCKSTKFYTGISYGQPMQEDKSKIRLFFYYSQIGYYEMLEFYTTTFNIFVANIGGHLGLWLGLSFLTIFQPLGKWLSALAVRSSSGKQGKESEEWNGGEEMSKTIDEEETDPHLDEKPATQ